MRPDWDAGERVGAAMSERAGGVSAAPYDTLNLGQHVGDAAEAVRENRARWQRQIGARPVYLRQVHGSTVFRATGEFLGAQPPEADAAVTTEPGIACTVLVADCMPVLLAAPDGRGVAAAHAGWRGLADGVLEAALQALCEAAACAPGDVAAWLGPCIGPRRFEVGAEVVRAFGAALDGSEPERFLPRPRPDGALRWLASLPRLGQERLRAAGVEHIAGGAWCTVEEGSRFFSYRRDGVTGRLAASVWIRG
jgi:YfiH family protein